MAESTLEVFGAIPVPRMTNGFAIETLDHGFAS
ncbi:uncharacterized protein METZ01_LOCUS476311 [marine metagenome]|uniref:Uncharacterized protein n=1 Tax=marine metagenome TaxID=408172 RepID=A0A383BTK8_9ZZZZ